MSTLKVSNFARQGYSIVFPLFLFFSAIFCMSTRTNNLLHLSILLLLLSLVRQENRQALAGVLREQWQTWTLLAAFFIYYALSNVWGHTPQHIDSPITHGVYLTGYLLLMTMLLRDGRTRRLAMLAVVGGITVLSLWTLIIDHTLVLTERAVSPENPGPTNVIDLAGYCGIGILICGMLLKEKASHWLYLPVVIMLVMLLLTQSRGPIIALVLAVGCTLHLHVFTRRNLLIAAAALQELAKAGVPADNIVSSRPRVNAATQYLSEDEELAMLCQSDGEGEPQLSERFRNIRRSLCTLENPLWFSHRRAALAGKRHEGRMLALIVRE